MKTAQVFQMGNQFTKGLIRLKQFKLISQQKKKYFAINK